MMMVLSSFMDEPRQLDTFNVVPDRDLVPMVDDLSQNYQRLRCRADMNNFVSCHSIYRTVCEILHVCGSRGRPILCDCYHSFGYEKPDLVGDVDFSDVCPFEGSRRLGEL